MVKNTRGVTLIELMMVVAIIGIAVAITPKILTQATQFFILGRVRLQLQSEARAAMYVINRELRQAQSNSIIIDQPAGQPYYSRMQFSKQLQGGNTTNVSIYQSGSSLLLSEGITISTMTKNLAYLSFTFPRSDDMTIVSVSFTLQEQIYNGAFKALHMASERVRVMN